MKHKRKTWLAIVMLALIGFVVAVCGEDTPSNTITPQPTPPPIPPPPTPPPCTHNWRVLTITTAPTSTTDGVGTLECIFCEEESIVLPALGTTGLVFELINNNTAYRVRGGTVTSGEVHIPAYYRPNLQSSYIPVIAIANEAFRNRGITAVTFLATTKITTIGTSAFRDCTSLTSVTLPAGLTSIGNETFYGCTSLTSISLPAGLTSIGISAFQNCTSLTSITLPARLTTIGNSAFRGCTSLTSISLPAGLTSIGELTFYGCTSLTSVTLPAGLAASIGNSAFLNTKAVFTVAASNSTFSVIDGGKGLVRNTELVAYPTASGAITLPVGLSSIGAGAFRSTDITSIILPLWMTSIGTSAFSGCKSLTSVTLPAELTSIGNDAFIGCTSLTSIILPAALTYIGDFAFNDYSDTILLTSVTFRNGPANLFFQENTFPGDLRAKFRAGGWGTYRRPAGSWTWTKQ